MNYCNIIIVLSLINLVHHHGDISSVLVQIFIFGGEMMDILVD